LKKRQWESSLNMFITPKIAFGVAASRFEAENSVGDDDETLDTYFKVRF